jgi:hypothetical protein
MLSMTNARRYGKYVYRIDGDEIMEPTMAVQAQVILMITKLIALSTVVVSVILTMANLQ